VPLPETVKALPPEDKLALVTAIWDDLATSAPISLPSDELFEMRRRRTELEHDPTKSLGPDELWRRVDGE